MIPSRFFTYFHTTDRATDPKKPYLCHEITLKEEMALNPNKELKQFYSIAEVGEIFNVPASLLRYWEKEFPHLRPKTVSSTGVRQYTEKDIEQVRLIYNLVKVRGFKLAAARKYLNENRKGVDRSNDVLETLISLRDQLKDLKRHLDAAIV